MYQQLIFVGNLGSDPEVRTTPDDKKVTNFSVAVNRYWNNAAGERQEEVTWFRVAAWGKLGEACNQYLSKGRQVLVEGRLVVSKETGGPRLWQNNDGDWRASFEVFAAEVKFLGTASSNGGEPPPKDEIPF